MKRSAQRDSIYFHLLKIIFHIILWSRNNWIYNRVIELIILFELVIMAKCNFKSWNAYQHAWKQGFLCVIFAINDVKRHRNETSWYWFLPKDTLHLYYRASVSMSHIIKGSHTIAAFWIKLKTMVKVYQCKICYSHTFRIILF